MFYDVAHCPLNSAFVITRRPDGDIRARIRLHDDTNCVHRAGCTCPSWGNIATLSPVFLHSSRSFDRKSRRGRGQFSRRARGENRQEAALINFCLSRIPHPDAIQLFALDKHRSNVARNLVVLLPRIILIAQIETSTKSVDNIFADAEDAFSSHVDPIYDFANLDLFAVPLMLCELILTRLERTRWKCR